MKRFIDDIAVQVIEIKLVAALGAIFSPVEVSSMDSDLVTLIAGESEESRVTREELTKQLAILQAGHNTCKSFISVRLGKEPVGDFRATADVCIDSGYCTSQPDSGSGDETPKDGDQVEHSVNSAGDELPPTADQSCGPSREFTFRSDKTLAVVCLPEPEPELAKDDDFWAVSKKDKKKKKKAGIWEDGPAKVKREEDWP